MSNEENTNVSESNEQDTEVLIDSEDSADTEVNAEPLEQPQESAPETDITQTNDDFTPLDGIEAEEIPAVENETPKAKTASAQPSKEKIVIFSVIGVVAVAVIALIILIATNVIPLFGDRGSSGPADPSENPFSQEDPVTPSEPIQRTTTGTSQYDDAYAAYPQDTVMAYAGEFVITWDEIFIGLREGVEYLKSLTEDGTGWQEMGPDDMTITEWLLPIATDRALELKAIEYGAALNNISLSAEDLDELNTGYIEMAAQFGGEEEFLQMLCEDSGFYSKSLFEYYVHTSYLMDKIFSELYGENGVYLPDEEIEEVIAEDGFLMAKHILILKPEDEEEHAAARFEAEDIWFQIGTYEGDDFDLYFDGLMFAFSEDEGGLDSHPEGYLFQEGDMVPEFYEATLGLEIGEVSYVVETTYGYHIIYRIPINYEVVPFSLYMQGEERSLRHLIAYHLFTNDAQEWKAALDVQYTDAYFSIEVLDIFS